MIYLRKFDNHAAYEAAESSLILPNVSLCVNENEVHYNPYADPSGGHEYVEIGGIKWATMNVGANSVTDTGLYFQWGDTQGYTAAQVGSGEGQKYFSEDDCIYCNNGSYTKYNAEDELDTLQESDDAVTAAWGGNWRMPTTAEFQVLCTATTSAWTADYEGSGVSGVVFTSKSDNSKKLFLPACGYALYGDVSTVGYNSDYWGISLSSEGGAGQYANCLFFSVNGGIWDSYDNRYYGYPVRGVLAN